MKLGSWPAIIVTWAFGVAAVASLSKLVVLSGRMGADMGVTGPQFAVLMGLVGLPGLVLSAPSGAAVDRFGPKAVLLTAAAVSILANAIYFSSRDLVAFQAARVIEGVSMVCAFAAGPALLMATPDDGRRIKAMTLWSTCAPLGFSLGLLISSTTAGRPDWRMAFVAHGAVFAIIGAWGLLLPAVAPAARAAMSLADRLGEMAAGFRRAPVVLLAVAFFLVSSLGFGSSAVLSQFIASSRHMALPTAANLIATTNLTMIFGSLAVAVLLSRGMSVERLLIGIAVLGIAAGALLYSPFAPFPATVIASIAWFVAVGAANAAVMATLPRVADPQRRGAAAGVFNQASAFLIILNPPLWFAILATGAWPAFVGLVAIGFIGAWLAVRHALQLETHA